MTVCLDDADAPSVLVLCLNSIRLPRRDLVMETQRRQGANGYVLSMGTKIWDPERTPEQGPEQTSEKGPEWKN